MKIWCLFSIENNYDQPPNNLIAWWSKKPDGDTIRSAISHHESRISNSDVEEILNGVSQRIDNTDYWIDEVEEGTIL